VRENNYQSASVLIVTAPARQFQLVNGSFGNDDYLSLVLAQTPDTIKFIFERNSEGHILVDKFISNTLFNHNITRGKTFFEMAFDANSKGMVLFNRSQHRQIISSLSGGDTTKHILEPATYSDILPPGPWILKTKDFQICMKIMDENECNIVDKAVQAGSKRKHEESHGPSQSRKGGASKVRKVRNHTLMSWSDLLNP